MKKKLICLLLAAMIIVLLPTTPIAQAAGDETWVNVGAAGISYGSADYTSIAFDSNGTLYLAYSDYYGIGNRATVKKYNGTSWETVGNQGFSAGRASYISLAIDPNDTPYIAYTDGGNSYKATVMKYNGTNWVVVGDAGFSSGEATNISLDIDHNGTPYVAYSDRAINYGAATVMKYNGTNWVAVGIAGFSPMSAYYTSLALDNDGTPYVAYGDHYNRHKATVMKYSDTAWDTVGEAFSDGTAQDISLAIDKNGTPYVAYRDVPNGFRATVMKFNGAAWELVGTKGFSAGGAGYTTLAIDNDGTPYVAYMDGGNNNKATVMKYNGTNWEPVGDAGISNGMAQYTSLVIYNNGTPYVAYQDYGNSGKATVMRLNTAPTNLSIDNSSINENENIGTVVGTLSVQDDNNDSHLYSFVSGTGDDDNTSFSISGNQLKTAAVFDYEAKNTYSIRVKATDIEGLEVEQTFNINVQDINEANVTFNSQGGSSVNNQIVVIGDYASEPSPDPTRSGFTFDGWYTDSDCSRGNWWNFNACQVINGITLYAKWTEKTKSSNISPINLDKSAKSSNTTLTDITVDSVSINGFSPVILSYHINVPNSRNSVQIDALAIDSDATISGDIGGFGLRVGDNSFSINVTAENGDIKTYSITICRASNDDATLQSFMVNGKMLIGFNPSITDYEMQVDKDTDKITLCYTPSSSNVKTSFDYPLSPGENVCRVKVTTNDFEQEYTLTINREKVAFSPEIKESIDSNDTTQDKPDLEKTNSKQGLSIFKILILIVCGIVLMACILYIVYWFKIIRRPSKK